MLAMIDCDRIVRINVNPNILARNRKNNAIKVFLTAPYVIYKYIQYTGSKEIAKNATHYY